MIQIFVLWYGEKFFSSGNVCIISKHGGFPAVSMSCVTDHLTWYLVRRLRLTEKCPKQLSSLLKYLVFDIVYFYGGWVLLILWCLLFNH